MVNNVNSHAQDSARVSGTDGSTGRQSPAAKPGAPSGKDMPDSSQTQKPSVEQHQKFAAQQAERVQKAVARLNDYIQSTQRDLRFSVDEELGRAVVTVVDRQSQEVIRQIPNETALSLARNLNDYIRTDLQPDNEVAGTSLGLIDTRI